MAVSADRTRANRLGFNPAGGDAAPRAPWCASQRVSVLRHGQGKRAAGERVAVFDWSGTTARLLAALAPSTRRDAAAEAVSRPGHRVGVLKQVAEAARRPRPSIMARRLLRGWPCRRRLRRAAYRLSRCSLFAGLLLQGLGPLLLLAANAAIPVSAHVRPRVDLIGGATTASAVLYHRRGSGPRQCGSHRHESLRNSTTPRETRGEAALARVKHGSRRRILIQVKDSKKTEFHIRRWQRPRDALETRSPTAICGAADPGSARPSKDSGDKP